MKNKLLYIFVAILLTACSDNELLIKPDIVIYTATTTVVEGGYLSPASQQITTGEKGVFNVVINNGFSLHSIQGCDGSLNGAKYTTGAMHSDCSITPIFKRVQETKSYLASTVTTQGGSLHPANQLIEAGQHGVFEIIIDNGFRLQSIQGCSGSLNGSTYTTGPMQAACTIAPVFSADTETPIYLANTATTEGGTLNPSSRQITEGQQGTFEVVADKGFGLEDITGCNGTLNGSTYTTGAMQNHCTITPTFKANIKTYVANTVAAKGGTLNPSSLQITEGQQGTFEVVADKDFSLEDISGCNGTLNGSTYTTGKMQADCHITPVFNINSYVADTITAEGGRLNPVSQTIEAGQQATFEIIVDEHFNLKSVQGCDGTLNGLTYTTGAMHANCNITPIFSIKTHVADTVTVKGGSLSPASQNIEIGKQGSFEVIADSGFVLSNIEGCNGTLNGLTYTTEVMNADCTITPTFITNAENAIANQDHTLATASELIEFSVNQITAIETNYQKTIKQLYQGVGNTITWNPTHDSITFSSFMPENTFTILPSNINGNGDSAISGLVMAGEQQDYRYAAMAGNLFSVNRSTETDALLKNLLSWLTQGEDSNSGFNIITAQMPSRSDSHYFRHNENIRIWLDEFYPKSHNINQANSCDYAELISCIDTQKPDLIILSDIDRQNLGYEGIETAIVKAKAQGIPLLLSNYQRNQSAMLAPLYLEMGLATSGNYWSKRQAKDLNIDEIANEDATLAAVKLLLTDLDTGNFDTSVLNDCTGNYLNCKTDAFLVAFKTGANWYRDNAITFDSNSLNIFAKNNFDLMKAGLLLADKYRSQIDYPITYDEHAQWQQALFADWLVSYIRPNNLAQPDLGEFVSRTGSLTKGTQAHYAYPETGAELKTISVPYSSQWTTTGWYALPGQTIKLTRLDASSANVKVKLNYHRANTNRAYQHRIYRAPLELLQQRLNLVANQPLEFSTPYGGPIYLYISGNDSLNVEVTAEGIAKHPTIMDFSDEEQIASFNEILENTELPHIDLRTDGAEQHLRRDRFTNAIKGDIADVNTLLSYIVNDHINNVYGLAGFKLQGKTLSESLPTDVLSICQGLFGEDCIDNSLHTRTTIQHANYDQNAHCGSGCSGNPWDAGWDIDPIGWGDNHELGHNLQTNRLNVQYATEANTNNWTGYSSRAGENSNNIFPYYVKWKTHYLRDGNTDIITDGHMNHKDLFYVFMSDAAGIKDSNAQRVIYDARCRLISSGSDRYTALWESNEYAIYNSYRMAFYIQMALKAHGMTMSEGSTLDNGFNIFTLLYQHSRIFGQYANNATDWETNRAKLGFSLFPYEDAIYGGNTITKMPGNDFMLVSLSKLTGKDWRSHFDMLGLRYSSLATAQVVENMTNGAVAMGMYQLETELPPANMSNELTFIPMSLTDGTTLWEDQTSPTQCK